MHQSAHEFALFSPTLALAPLKKGQSIALDDPGLVHRITRILRVRTGERIILFDRSHYAPLIIQTMAPKQIVAHVQDAHLITPLSPSITIGLPLLKREALEASCYNAVELGANQVHLLVTEKSQSPRRQDLERLHRIMIAAAEQSKNFSLPTITPPTAYSDWVITRETSYRIMFTPNATPLFDVLAELHDNRPPSLTLLLGPEADLTPQEKELALNNAFISCALGQTVLRAHQALSVGLGSMRATLSKPTFK